MNVKWVETLPQHVNEALGIERRLLGVIPVRLVVIQRVEGWCVYAWPKYLPLEYTAMYGSPPPFANVLLHGDKIGEDDARRLFPDMEGNYAW